MAMASDDQILQTQLPPAVGHQDPFPPTQEGEKAEGLRGG